MYVNAVVVVVVVVVVVKWTAFRSIGNIFQSVALLVIIVVKLVFSCVIRLICNYPYTNKFLTHRDSISSVLIEYPGSTSELLPL